MTWSRLGGDVDEICGRHNARRTSASASLKVGRRLSYQAAVWGRIGPARVCNSCAQSVTREYRPSRAGVVLGLPRAIQRI